MAVRILTVAEMQESDRQTIAAGTPGAALMEHAGQAVTDIIMRHYAPCPMLVLCGPGNNGGDGFVIARLLREAGWIVRIAAMKTANDYSGDAALMAQQCGGDFEVLSENLALQDTALVVDALFGTGFSKALAPDIAAVLQKIAAANLPVIAVDIPSGINGDSGATDAATPKAAHTVTFHAKKPGHLLLPGRDYCGQIHVADIGITAEQHLLPALYENSPALWHSLFPQPKTGDNKYSHGHAVIFGGAKMTGAAKLAAHAAMRSGAGLATILCPPKSFDIYAAYKPHLLVEPLAALAEKTAFLQDPRKNAVLLGPGLGVNNETREAVLAALAEKDKAVCLDADALSVFHDTPEDLFAALHENCILTPHDGEFARLFGAIADDKMTDKIARARTAAAKSGAVVLLKGADTVIAAPDGRAVINTNAPAFLATAGAGDVLAGMITGLLAQHMPAFEVAAAAAWLHGAAAQKCGRGLVAEDLAEQLPAVLKELDNHAPSD